MERKQVKVTFTRDNVIELPSTLIEAKGKLTEGTIMEYIQRGLIADYKRDQQNHWRRFLNSGEDR